MSSTPPVDHLALAALMRQVQMGDHPAFHELYALTHVRVRRTIDRTVCAPDHAAEIVQEVYLHTWEHARTYDAGRGTVLGWLLMLGHRRAVDRVRAVVRATARDQHGTWDSDVTADASVLGLARHEAAAVRTALCTLTSRQRDAVALTYLHGLSHVEAADRLGIPLGTLKTRVRDGLTSLRRSLGCVAA